MLPGSNNKTGPDPLQRTQFRSSWTQPEGTVGATIIEAKIVDINVVLWTVDVVSQFDQKYFFGVQVASPYMHSNAGEGFYAMPELGSKCHLAIPSDGPPPYVLDFIMPQESIPNAATDDSPEGTTPTNATFAGGRVRAKPGDICVRGRDGNFIILHRGGVLQIGATELAQRIYIPLQNLVTDISQNYRHYNTGGSVNWFLAAGESETNPPTILKETYRLMAGDAKATIRITKGLLKDFVPEPSSGGGSDISAAGIGSEPIVWEVVIAPDGFDPDNGAIDANTPKKTKLRYFFDKGGNAFLRTEGSVVMVCHKKLRAVVSDDIAISTKKNFTLTVGNTTRIDGGKLLELTAKLTKINGGTKPVAHVGAVVECRITVPLSGIAGAGPAALPVVIPPISPLTFQPQVLKGVILSGNSTILV